MGLNGTKTCNFLLLGLKYRQRTIIETNQVFNWLSYLYACLWVLRYIFKWVLTEFLCVREKLNSMNLLLYMAPMAVVFLLPATLIMEENVVGITLALARDDSKIIWYLLFNSSLAYFVNLTNFLVTKHTSALTLQVSPDYLFKLAFIPFCFFKCTFHSNKLSVVSSVGSWDIRFWWLSNHKICITLSALSWSLFCFFVSSVAMWPVVELFCSLIILFLFENGILLKQITSGHVKFYIA